MNLSAKLKKVSKLTHDVRCYFFEWLGEPVDFKPGQFFMIKVPGEKVVTRSYSISSPPRPDGFELCVKLVPDGLASGYLDSLSEGDEVEFMAPFGHFVLQEADAPVVMVATGTGLAPFMSMLPVLFERGFSQPVTLLFGVRHESDLFYMDELRNWEAEHPNFKAIATLSRPDEDWDGAQGRVTEHFEAMELAPETHVYICGAGPMVKDVRALATEKGLPKQQIHLEQFTTL